MIAVCIKAHHLIQDPCQEALNYQSIQAYERYEEPWKPNAEIHQKEGHWDIQEWDGCFPVNPVAKALQCKKD